MIESKRLALAALAFFSIVVPSQAQETLRFQWKRGQVLQYQVVQTTRATDTTAEGKSELSSRVEQTKQWRILDVDANGVGTLQLEILRMKMQQHLPSGEKWEFDSTAPDQAHPQLREPLGALLNKPLAVLRVDALGRVLEVKSTTQGPASRYESELPFAVTLPSNAVQPGQTWNRTYRVVLDPPFGTGEKFAAEQVCQLHRAMDGRAIITFASAIKDLPKEPADRLPLLQMQPKGQIVYDPKLGLGTQARYSSGGVVEGHQGPGSRYEFSSDYQEQLTSH